MISGRLKLVLIIAVICWVLLTLFILFLFWISHLDVKDKTGMINDNTEVVVFEYGSFGGMNGDSTTYTIRKIDSKKAKITYSYTNVSGDTKEKSKEVSIDVLNEISEIFIRCNVANWGKLKTEEPMLLDAPTTYIAFKTADEFYSIYDYHITPKKGSKIFSDTTNVLHKYFEE